MRGLRRFVPSHSFLVAAVVVAGACATSPSTGSRSAAADGPALDRRAQASRPAVGVVPPNLSRLEAIVVRHAIYPPGTLAPPPPVIASATYYSLTLDVRSATPARPDVESVARAGGTIEAFSTEPLATNVDGRRIEAVVSLVGDTRGRRWTLQHARPID